MTLDADLAAVDSPNVGWISISSCPTEAPSGGSGLVAIDVVGDASSCGGAVEEDVIVREMAPSVGAKWYCNLSTG